MSRKNEAVDSLVELAKKLFELLELDTEVAGSQPEEGIISLSISTQTPALVIGYHGKTLESVQGILNTVAYKKFGQTRVLIDVDGWRERREETISQIAKNAASRAKETGVPQPIYNLTSYERRIVHIALSDDPEVLAESEGEGRDRHIVVKKKEQE